MKWTDCGDGIDCGTAEVPLDYRHPDGKKITLALTRKLASDPTKRAGTLFLNTGGPGGTNEGFVYDLAADAPEKIRSRYDLIAVDPRGTGYSTPVKCQTTREWSDAWDTATARPARGGFERAVARGRQFGEACRRHSGDLLPYIGTEYVARDMDVIRAAVGDRRFNWYGLSYGTYIGTVYAGLFPQRVGVMALDGGYDPNAYANDPYRYDRGQYVAVDAALGRFFDWCERAPDSCAFGDGDPRKAYRDLQAALDEKPVRDADGRLVANGAWLTMNVTYNIGIGKDFWPTLAQQLVDAQNRTGDLLSGMKAEAQFQTENTAVECADRAFPRSQGLLRLALWSETAQAPLNGPALAYGPPNYDHGHAAACVQWPAERLSRYSGPFDAKGSAPILVIGSTGDPDTPYQDSVTLARTLDNAQLLTVRKEGHVGRHNECVRTATMDYLATGKLPRQRVCQGD
ncbi:alpha/beta fold hydrolase [Streptomyces tuirus]|uniref:Alpha/beta fold hydrolase n=1 Tax=Streptomyces tuirus TaxID=68278 RepID=A0A941FI76_9ACTN|nr:alpha/beta fold hydrolase [Streptomyces tuirus]